MTNPVNIAIYALGGFMLFALAIGFFAAPVSVRRRGPASGRNSAL